ncbi:MAG: hypothetical protein RI906_444 [Pseudomonadota bacterium]|jgi:3-methylfumaryl-CoA hydratase
MTTLSDWVGRTQSATERADARLIRWVAAAVDRHDLIDARDGSPIPPGWHWVFFAAIAPRAELGRDGHPRPGGFLPATGHPRRMWAGSRLRWHEQLRAGCSLRRDSTIASCTEKAGRTGSMVLVTVAHQLYADEQLVLEEEHDIVYRDEASRDEIAALAALAERARSGLARPEREGLFNHVVEPDPTLLFRYSAATFNGHRIHYDREYAARVEGYPGLVVHGPLLATLLLDFIERTVAPGRALREFSFRAKRPTFDIASFGLHAQAPDAQGALEVWTTNNVGEVGLEAKAVLV